MVKSQPPQPLKPHEAYDKRNVGAPRPVAEMKQEWLSVNRILQPGAMHRDSEEFIRDAKLVKNVEWLTDYAALSTENSLFLNIAKEVVCKYQVDEKDMNDKAHEIYDKLKNDTIIEELNKEIENQLELKIKSTNFEKEVKALLSIGATTTEVEEAAKRLIKDKYRKEITNKVVGTKIKKEIENRKSEFSLVNKPLNEIGSNEDICLLGAAGSGKSTMLKKLIAEEEKQEYVSLSTDVYRCFTLPNQEEFEKTPTEHVFIKSQDTAYLVKELVTAEFTERSKQNEKRPNVIFDGVTLGYKEKEIFAPSQEKLTSVMAAFVGEGYVGIAERAHHRAIDPEASPADKGRHANTEDLLKGHAKASHFISTCPENVKTKIYDTSDGEAGLVAELDSEKKELKIHDLKFMATFMNKVNLNNKATRPIELIFKEKTPFLITNPQIKAQAFLDNLSAAKDYTFKLMDNGEEYMEFMVENMDVKDTSEDKKHTQLKVKKNISNNEIYNKKIDPLKNKDRTMETDLLKEIVSLTESSRHPAKTIKETLKENNLTSCCPQPHMQDSIKSRQLVP